jgi:hypothetical protein
VACWDPSSSPGPAWRDVAPRDVDREFVGVLHLQRARRRGPGLMRHQRILLQEPQGLPWGRAEGRWYILGMGNESTFTPPLARQDGSGRRQLDRRIERAPATMVTADMNADSVGNGCTTPCVRPHRRDVLVPDPA